jgi:HAE1 family hydrophobic/amphiphilic exporter-1
MFQMTKFSLRNPIAVFLLAFLAMFGGLYATTTYKQEAMPDISIPVLFVTAAYPGAAPQEVQNDVTIPLEKALKNVEGVQTVSSTAATNIATVTLLFDYSADVEEKKKLTEDILATLKLPTGVDTPKVNALSFTDTPVLYTAFIAKEGTSDEQLQERMRNDILPTLQGVEGIGRLQVMGLPSKNIYINLDQAKLNDYKVTLQQVQQLLQASNVSLPAGSITIENKNNSVQLTGKFTSLDDVKS